MHVNLRMMSRESLSSLSSLINVTQGSDGSISVQSDGPDVVVSTNNNGKVEAVAAKNPIQRLKEVHDMAEGIGNVVENVIGGALGLLITGALGR